jgi:hypothetical protein
MEQPHVTDGHHKIFGSHDGKCDFELKRSMWNLFHLAGTWLEWIGALRQTTGPERKIHSTACVDTTRLMLGALYIRRGAQRKPILPGSDGCCDDHMQSDLGIAVTPPTRACFFGMCCGLLGQSSPQAGARFHSTDASKCCKNNP